MYYNQAAGQWLAMMASPEMAGSYAAALMPPFSTANPALPLQTESTPFGFPPKMATYAAARMPQAAPAPARHVVVRSVWASNMEREVRLIETLLPCFPCAAMDTEYPGTVHRSSAPAYALSGESRYALMRANVDELPLLQLGLTLFDAAGRLPDLGAAVQCVWEFNFREFDARRHPHAPESVAMLRATGMDFDRALRDGVDMAAFAPRLRALMRGGLGAGGLVTFSGAYDVAYLVKMMALRPRLPDTAVGFVAYVQWEVRKLLYDVKEMAARCPGDFRGGLELVAKKLGVPRVVGEAHQAGSDSLLTCHIFLKMREAYFHDDAKLATVAGLVTGITSC